MPDLIEAAVQLDMLVDGRGVRRSVDVHVSGERLVCGDLELPLTTVYWVARRSGLLLLFARRVTLALKGPSDRLETVSRAISSSVDDSGWRQRLLEILGPEVIRFTAGCAVAGVVESATVRGLCVAACTRRGLHLFAREERWTLPWPVDAITHTPDDGAGRGGTLVLRKGEDRLMVRYLFPEEVESVLEVAERLPVNESPNVPLELFTRGEVAPPTPAQLPPFSRAAGALQLVAEEAAARVPKELQADKLLPPYFLETHFLELGEIALGPLLLRKSAAAAAGSLERAVRALNAEELRVDIRAAVAAAGARLVLAYTTEAERLLTQQRVPRRLQKELAISASEREELVARMRAPVDRLDLLLDRLLACERVVLDRLARLDSGPPEGAVQEVEEGARQWRDALDRLDRAYEKCWRDLADQIERMWSDILLPRLGKVGGMHRRRVPEWVQLVLLGMGALIIGAAIVRIFG